MPSGMATVIHFGYPVFVLLGSLIFLRRRVPKLKIVCVGLCMIGIFLSYAGSGGEAKPVSYTHLNKTSNKNAKNSSNKNASNASDRNCHDESDRY